MFRWSSTKRMVPAACLLTLGLSVSCSTENKKELSREPQIVYETIKDPIAEMCTDDSGARTEYINVPLVRFTGSNLELDGASMSATELLQWARREYTNGLGVYVRREVVVRHSKLTNRCDQQTGPE
jgi:hypothetical protein